MAENLDELLAAALGRRLGFGGPFPAEATRFVRRRAAEDGVEPAAWLRTVEVRPADLRDLIAAATVPHTAFYRHPEQITRFRAALPELVQRSRPVRIWSAGCATGEEPWTLAIVAAELGVAVDILATDVNRRALEKAEEGQYEARSTYGLPGFDGKRPYRVPDGLRKSVRFEVGSIVSRECEHHGPFDAIFCRNVLIYFDATSVERAFRAFDGCLQPWGIVVVAPVEALLRVPATFRSTHPIGWLQRAAQPDVGAYAPAARAAAAPSPRPAEVEPGPSIAPFERVARLLRADATDAAEQLLHQILSVRDDALGWFLLGETCARRGELTQARIAYERAAKATEVPPEADLDTVRAAALRHARQLGG